MAALATLLCAPLARAAAWTDADTLSGVQADSQFGWWVAGAGDLDGDGFTDLAVGAHFFTTVAETAAGSVDLFGGGFPPGSPPSLRLFGTSPHEHFGECIAGGRDIDGDGRPDLVVGAPLRDAGALSAAGGVDVFLGGPGLVGARWAALEGEAADDWFGQSVAVGDLDGDGKAEIIVGAPYNDRGGIAAGAVFIYKGGTTPPTTPWKVLVGEFTNDQFGWSVAYVGDVNGDGFGDLVVGARLHNVPLKLGAGRAYLYLGGPAMDAVADGNWSGEAANDWFGNSVWGPGDVDGGGRPDILVGAPYNDRGGSAAGAAYLFRGEDAPGSAPAAIYVGESANAQMGWAVGGAGDVDGDGHPEVLVGARFQASGLLGSAGRVYVYPGGAAHSTTPIATADGEAADDWLGNSVADGRGFFNATRGVAFAGAPLDDHAASAAGRAYALGERPSLSAPLVPARGALAVRPTPARGPVELAWPSAPGGSVEVWVFDVGGRLVRRWNDAVPGADGLRTRWDCSDAAGRPVQAGLYLVRVRATGPAGAAPTATARVVVAR